MPGPAGPGMLSVPADTMNYWLIIYRFAWALLGVLLVIGLLCIFVPKCNSLRALQNKRTALQQENSEIESGIKEMRTMQEKFQSDPDFVERVARESGLIKSNEVVFKFAEPAAP